MPPDLLVGERSAEVLLDVDVQDRPELMVLAVRNESDQEDLSVGEREVNCNYEGTNNKTASFEL